LTVSDRHQPRTILRKQKNLKDFLNRVEDMIKKQLKGKIMGVIIIIGSSNSYEESDFWNYKKLDINFGIKL